MLCPPPCGRIALYANAGVGSGGQQMHGYSFDIVQVHADLIRIRFSQQSFYVKRTRKHRKRACGRAGP